MAIFDAFSISASGLSAERTRMQAVAENIANIHTTRQDGKIQPYQRKEVVFEEVLKEKSDVPVGGVNVEAIEADDAPPRLVYRPDHPDADSEGYVKMPNIDMHFEMVDLMSSSRAYQANLVAMKLFRNMVQETLNI